MVRSKGDKAREGALGLIEVAPVYRLPDLLEQLLRARTKSFAPVLFGL